MPPTLLMSLALMPASANAFLDGSMRCTSGETKFSDREGISLRLMCFGPLAYYLCTFDAYSHH
jgi:hypothetical protein